MSEKNGEQMLTVVQQCLENERRQTRMLLVVVGLVMVIVLGIGGVFMVSMSKQNARLQEMVLGKGEGGKEGREEGTTTPSLRATPSPDEGEVKGSVESSTVDVQSKEQSTSNIEHPTSNVEHPTSNKDTPPPRQRDPNEIINLAMPDVHGDPVRIPGYTEEKINLVTERGVVIPWLVIVPE